MEFVNRLARSVGSTIESEQSWVRDESRGKRSYFFHSPETDEVRSTLLECINQRLQKYCSEFAETIDGKREVEATATPQNYIDIGDDVAVGHDDLDPLDEVENSAPESEVIQLPVITPSAPIKVGDIVRRKEDGARFRVKSVSDGRAWLQWLDQHTPMLDILLPLQELEVLPSSQIRRLTRPILEFPEATG
jgi:hypothetical protein